MQEGNTPSRAKGTPNVIFLGPKIFLVNPNEEFFFWGSFSGCSFFLGGVSWLLVVLGGWANLLGGPKQN